MSLLPTAKLLVPRNEAEEKIKRQVKKGSEILRSPDRAPLPHEVLVGVERTFEEAEAEREKWAKFTVHLLTTLFDSDSVAREFGETWLHYSASEVDEIVQFRDWMKGKIVRLESVLERLEFFPLAEKPVQATAAPAPPKQQSRDIFMVHGHDGEAEHEVARFIEQLGLHPIILHEKPDRGRTVIEKVEDHSDVGFAVVLLTPDDVGHPKDKPDEPKPRARQNVVLELGYFIGKLGRARVCALLKGDIEIPTDFVGVLYKPMDATGKWRLELAREINAAGIDVDLKKLL